MRIIILCFAILISITPTFAFGKKDSKPLVTTPPGTTQVPIDEEFQQEFVYYVPEEAKAFEKEQKEQRKLEQKRLKLAKKKERLEAKRQQKIDNNVYCRLYIEKIENAALPNSKPLKDDEL